jgi:drug/metabolite transporter (DMT)-like permease
MMLLSSVLFSVMSAMVRELTEVDAYTIVLMRFVVGGLVVGGLFVSGLQKMRWTNWPWITARGVSGGLACVLFYWSIQHLGLAKAVLLNYTYVIFAAIFAVPILGERIRLPHWAAMGVAAVGIALLCGVQQVAVGRGDVLALAAGVVGGFAVVSLTRCRETDSSSNIFWSQCLFGIAIAAWPAGRSWTWPTPGQWVMLIIISLLAAAGQLTMTYAYKFTGAAYGSLLSLLTPVLSAVIGILYFQEHQTASFFAGAFLVLLACGYLSLHPVTRAVRRTAEAEKCR